MNGFQFFKRSVDKVFHNLDDALAISGLIWIASLALIVVFSGLGDPIQLVEGEEITFSSKQFLSMLGVNLTVMLAGVWIAVEWHRYALLGEKPQTIIPPFRLQFILGYVGRSFLLGLIVLGVMFAISLIVTLAFSLVGLIKLAAVVIVGLAGVVGFYFFLRMSPILPAAAIGAKLTLKEAWAQTEQHSTLISQVAVLNALLTIVAQIPSFFLGGGLIGLLVSLILGWVILIVNVSLLSSIYELVEGKQK